MNFNLASAVRQQTDAVQLQTLELKDLIDFVKATDLQIVIDKKATTERLHIIGVDGYMSIRIGDKVELTETGKNRIKELVDNYLIYCGVSDEGHSWMTFGPKRTASEPVVKISVEDYFKSA